jgi:hypothetical protein
LLERLLKVALGPNLASRRAYALAIQRRNDFRKLINPLREDLLERIGERLLVFARNRGTRLPDDQIAVCTGKDLPNACDFVRASVLLGLEVRVEILNDARCHRRRQVCSHIASFCHSSSFAFSSFNCSAAFSCHLPGLTIVEPVRKLASGTTD